MDSIGSHFCLELNKFICKTNIASKVSLAPNQEENIIFDVGYPDFLNEHVFFEIYIIKDFDWDTPLSHYKTQDIFKVINILKNSLGKYSKRR